MMIPPSVSKLANKGISYTADHSKSVLTGAVVKGGIVGTGIGVYQVSKPSSKTASMQGDTVASTSASSKKSKAATIAKSILIDTAIATGIGLSAVGGAKLYINQSRKHAVTQRSSPEKRVSLKV